MGEDSIDFRKLEKEFQNAFDKEDKYTRENAAKFRAVEQRVESYEQFRDIVLASHLKPLDRKDITGQKGRNQPLNSLCTTKLASDHVEDTREEIKIPGDKQQFNSKPISSDDFIKTWKNISPDSDERYVYMVKIEETHLKKIFISDIIGTVLGEIIICFEKLFCSSDAEKITMILEHIHHSKRFTLSLQFLSRKEREALVELFRKLHESLNEKQYIDSLRIHYKVS